MDSGNSRYCNNQRQKPTSAFFFNFFWYDKKEWNIAFISLTKYNTVSLFAECVYNTRSINFELCKFLRNPLGKLRVLTYEHNFKVNIQKCSWNLCVRYIKSTWCWTLSWMIQKKLLFACKRASEHVQKTRRRRACCQIIFMHH